MSINRSRALALAMVLSVAMLGAGAIPAMASGEMVSPTPLVSTTASPTVAKSHVKRHHVAKSTAHVTRKHRKHHKA